MGGVVAAGHPLTAQAGADVLRDGGNAVDAAVAAVLMSFVTESPLTGPGAGGFMLVHTAEGENHLLDFFVVAPGMGLEHPQPAPLVPIDVAFAPDAIQRFNCGPSSCGVYGTSAGLAHALSRFGTVALGDLTGGPARAAREGVEVIPMQAFLFAVLAPIMASTPEAAAIYEPEGRPLRAGERIYLPELADLLDRLGSRGAGVPLHGRRRGERERLGARTRRAADPRGPGGLRGRRARGRCGRASAAARCSPTRPPRPAGS